MKSVLNNHGFTLVELLMAMAFFGFLLLMVTFGFVQINRSYTRGITIKTIQESTRSIMEDITRSARSSSEVTYMAHQQNISNGYQLCFSNVRYVWNQHIESAEEGGNSIYNPTNAGLTTATGQRDFTIVKSADGEACGSPVNETDAEEILDPRASVQHLSVNRVEGLNAFKLSLVISTRYAVENDLNTFGREAVCRVQVGDQFCGVARFETAVTIRN